MFFNEKKTIEQNIAHQNSQKGNIFSEGTF